MSGARSADRSLHQTLIMATEGSPLCTWLQPYMDALQQAGLRVCTEASAAAAPHPDGGSSAPRLQERQQEQLQQARQLLVACLGEAGKAEEHKAELLAVFDLSCSLVQGLITKGGQDAQPIMGMSKPDSLPDSKGARVVNRSVSFAKEAAAQPAAPPARSRPKGAEVPMDSLMEQLYAKLGGFDPVAAAVQSISNLLAGDPRTASFFEGRDPARLMAKMTCFTACALSGKLHHTADDIYQIHTRDIEVGGLRPEHVDVLLEHLGTVLRDLGIPETMVKETLDLLDRQKYAFAPRVNSEAGTSARNSATSSCPVPPAPQPPPTIKAAHEGLHAGASPPPVAACPMSAGGIKASAGPVCPFRAAVDGVGQLTLSSTGPRLSNTHLGPGQLSRDAQQPQRN